MSLGVEILTIRGSIKYKKEGKRCLKKNQMEKREVQMKNRKLMITVFYITNNLFRSLVSLFPLIFI